MGSLALEGNPQWLKTIWPACVFSSRLSRTGSLSLSSVRRAAAMPDIVRSSLIFPVTACYERTTATPSDFGTGRAPGENFPLRQRTIYQNTGPHRNPARLEPSPGFDHSIENQPNWKAARARKRRAWQEIQGEG